MTWFRLSPEGIHFIVISMVYGAVEYWSNGVLEELPIHYLMHYSSVVSEKPRKCLFFSNTPILHYSSTPKRINLR